MTTAATRDPDVLLQADTRRTFAIISHPDAGKTTLTEKFLLYAGAVQEAGAVKSRRSARATISDWMTLEQERGISISSTVLAFLYGSAAGDQWRFNLLDTPGHADFSEDTYRTLCAADAAIMVLDAAKGLEPQTLKLFRVCRDRGLPIVTFVNKCDRPGLPPLALLDQIADQIDLQPIPLVWPIADGPEFVGVVDRRAGELVRFDRGAHGARVSDEDRMPLDKARRLGPLEPCPPDRWQAAMEELELVEDLELDRRAFLDGTQTPVFFGSALANFGVRLLLEGFAALAPPPTAMAAADAIVRPVDAPFSAFVFKIQANMDPRHRDRVAFLRICSGRFTRGMSATVARTGRPFALKYAHQLFGQERDVVDEALPGDVIGVVNAADLRVGDTLFTGPPVTFPPIPTFSPERFVVVRNRDTSRYKQFRRGLVQLDEEGTVHVLRRPEFGDQEPLLAGVGQLQFEVAAHRMTTEFGCTVSMEPASWQLARRVAPADVDKLRGQRGTQLVHDSAGRPLVLFASDYALQWAQQDHPDVEFAELGLARAS